MIVRIDVPRESKRECPESVNCFWIDTHDKNGLNKVIAEIKEFMSEFNEIPQIEIRTGLFCIFEIKNYVFENLLQEKTTKIEFNFRIHLVSFLFN